MNCLKDTDVFNTQTMVNGNTVIRGVAVWQEQVERSGVAARAARLHVPGVGRQAVAWGPGRGNWVTGTSRPGTASPAARRRRDTGTGSFTTHLWFYIIEYSTNQLDSRWSGLRRTTV